MSVQDRPRVLVTRRTFDEVLASLRERFDVDDNQGDVPLAPDELRRRPDADVANAQDEDDGQCTDREVRGPKIDDQQFESDQHEEHRVQDLVDQLPELVHVFGRGIAHGVSLPLVADQDTGGHHGERAAHMERVRQ